MRNRKKKYGLLLILLVPIFLMAACDERSTTYVIEDDTTAPPVPVGVTTTTGDGIVWVNWEPIIGVSDLDGFKVWRSINNIEFFLIATVGRNVTEYEDNGVTNGETYFYGVSSFDYDGNESDASFDYEISFDTPRPEGYDQVLFDFNEPGRAGDSGFDFYGERVVHYESIYCDVYLEYDTFNLPAPTFYLWLGYNGEFFQDMGYTDSFDDITYAPGGDDGWSSNDWIEVIAGHTYVIKTWDNHYVKMRVTLLDTYPENIIMFDWGYQIDPGNRELKVDPRTIEVAIADNGAVQ